jgi:protein-S-isoprenylcysteine O-methyltransferase Ste14
MTTGRAAGRCQTRSLPPTARLPGFNCHRVLIQRAAPLPFVPGTLAVPLGVSLVVVAIALFTYSVAKFRAAGTPVPARKPTTMIVRTGPYRFSRNPIYLAFSLFQLGIAIWINSLWLLVTLVGAVGLMHYVVIPREELWNEDSALSTRITSSPCAAGCRPSNHIAIVLGAHTLQTHCGTPKFAVPPRRGLEA